MSNDTMERSEIDALDLDTYKFGFNDGDVSVFKMDLGLNEHVIREISSIKNEPEWMLEFRLESYKKFLELPMPEFGANLSDIDFNQIRYFVKASTKSERSWEDVPENIKDTFERLGIPQAEREYLAGVTTQYESEAVYHNMHKDLEEQGVIFTDTDAALREYPELFKKYFATLVKNDDNKFAALNSAVWSGGSFIYIPKGVKLEQPLQTYFRINSEKMGQFERTLIIVDEDADLHYVEGCTAPTYSADSMHAAVVEIIVHKNGRCRYTTIQNWSNNVYNLVTKRAMAEENAEVEWIDGNLGSKVTMKYPAVVLAGERAKGTCISIALAGEGQHQDAGAKMIHLAPNTSSSIVSKSISRNGGNVTYRGIVKHGPKAHNSKSNIECDTIIMDEHSKSDTIPYNEIHTDSAVLQHEATVSKVSEEQLFYLMSRGLSQEEATEMIIMGFIEPFSRELPMEYAVELNTLIKYEMEGSIG